MKQMFDIMYKIYSKFGKKFINSKITTWNSMKDPFSGEITGDKMFNRNVSRQIGFLTNSK